MLEQEPPDADDPILKLDNVILAPHALCWTDQCFAGNGAADVAAVLEVQHGREPRGVVNREVLSSESLDETAGGPCRARRHVDGRKFWRVATGGSSSGADLGREARPPRQRTSEANAMAAEFIGSPDGRS